MLHLTYRDYLRAGATRADAGALAPLLAATRPLESAALAHYAAHGAGTFTHGDEDSAQLVHVGPTVPVASVGDVWVDTAEAAAMMLVPAYVDHDDRDALAPEAIARLPLQSSWIALRPTARYQLAGWLAASNATARFDAEHGAPFAPATGIAYATARAYLSYFGKLFPSEQAYLAATEHGVPLWAEPPREWTGLASFDDSLAIVLNPNTLHTDPRDVEDETDPEFRMLYPAAAPSTAITFRSSVLTQLGLRVGPDRFARPSAFTPAHVRRMAEALCRLERAEPAATIAATALGGAFEDTPSWVTVASPPPGARVAKLAKREGLVDHAVIELEPGAAPTLAALEAALGPGTRPPVMAPQPLFQVFHKVVVAGAPFTCAVIAQLGKSPGPDDIPHTIVLRRDRAPKA